MPGQVAASSLRCPVGQHLLTHAGKKCIKSADHGTDHTFGDIQHQAQWDLHSAVVCSC